MKRLLITLLLSMMAGTAAAQQCGDADGNGVISVSDGVNVLRQAASLPSTCSADPTRCDLDGNGVVTVSDGVSVLRHGAGLSATLSCPSANDGVGRFAGTYRGTFSGDDHGDFDVEVSCTGEIDGVGYSAGDDEEFDVFGDVSADGEVTLTGGTSSAATFHGTMQNDGRVSGTWRNRLDGSDGTFQGSRTDPRSCR